MAKTLEEPKTGDVIPPPKGKSRVNLVTLGEVRSEMGAVYNAHRRGEVTETELTRRVWALRQIAQTIEAAEKLGIGGASDADERPVFAGLTIVSPPKHKLLNGGGAQPEPKRKQTNGT